MKKWLAISINSSPSGATLGMALVSGSLVEGFRIQKPQKLDFLLEGEEIIGRLADHMNMQVLGSLGKAPSQQKILPIVIGIQPSILPQLTSALGMSQEVSLHQMSIFLGDLWLGLFKRTTQKVETLIQPAAFVDELEWWKKIQEDIPDHIAMAMQGLVDGIHHGNNLDILQDLAFQDGADSVQDYQESDIVTWEARIPRFSLFGHTFGSQKARIRFTYLNAHPLLKSAFIAWMISKWVKSRHDIHYGCVKTPSDPRSPQEYANILITMLADECARDEGKLPIGHIQETV